MSIYYIYSLKSAPERMQYKNYSYIFYIFLKGGDFKESDFFFIEYFRFLNFATFLENYKFIHH
jgi:hypothetical protein